MAYDTELIEFHPQQFAYGSLAMGLVACDAGNSVLFIEWKSAGNVFLNHLNRMISSGTGGVAFEACFYGPFLQSGGTLFDMARGANFMRFRDQRI